MLRKLSRSAEALLNQSAKLQCLSELIPSLTKRGHRMLVFSQSVKMLDLIQILILKPNGIRCLRIDGQTDPMSREDKMFRLQVFKMGLTRTALESSQTHNYFTAREI